MAVLSLTQERVLRAIDEYIHITNDQLRRMLFPTATLNCVSKHTSALCKKGLVVSSKLPDRHYWFRATPRAQRILGTAVRRHWPAEMGAIFRDLAIVELCLASEPRLRRWKSDAMSARFSDIDTTRLKRPICFDGAVKRIDLIFVRQDIDVAGIVRDCWNYVQRLREYESPRRFLAKEQLRLVVITGTRHQAKEIQQGLERRSGWPLPRYVVSCPLLAQLRIA